MDPNGGLQPRQMVGGPIGSNERFDHMFQFNDLIRDLQLMEVPLQNRDFTWTNKQPAPIMSKLDRVFLTPDWALKYPVITLTALEMIVSDHVPLMLTCKTPQAKTAPFRLERFWFRYQYAHDMVTQIWGNQQGSGPATTMNLFETKTDLLHKELRL